MSTSFRAGLAGVIAAFVTAPLLSGCGGGATPVVTAAEQVPTLERVLSQVDAALQDRQFTAARRSLAKLIVETTRAERAGKISAAAAGRIITAARELRALIPKSAVATPPEQLPPVSVPSATPTPSTTPSATPTPTSKPTPSPTPSATPTTNPTPTTSGDPSPTATPSPGEDTVPEG